MNKPAGMTSRTSSSQLVHRTGSDVDAHSTEISKEGIGFEFRMILPNKIAPRFPSVR
jgi:hypothetical protein